MAAIGNRRARHALVVACATLVALAGIAAGGTAAHAVRVASMNASQQFAAQLARAETMVATQRNAGPAKVVADSGRVQLKNGALILEARRLRDQRGLYSVFAGTYQQFAFFGSVAPQWGTPGTMIDLWRVPLAALSARPTHVAYQPMALTMAQIEDNGVVCAEVTAVGGVIVASIVCSETGPGALLCQTVFAAAGAAACSLPFDASGVEIDKLSADCVTGHIVPKGCDVKFSAANAQPDGSAYADAGIWVTWMATTAISWENSICSATFNPTPTDGCTYGGGFLHICATGTGLFGACVANGGNRLEDFTGRIVSDQNDCGPNGSNIIHSATVEFWVDLLDGSRSTATIVAPVSCTG